MEDDGAIEDIFDLKPFIIKGIPGVALIAKKGKQISRMPGMRLVIGIVVFTSFGKILGAVTVFVNVKGIETGASRDRNVRKIKQFSLNQNSAVRSIIKFDQATDLWIIRTALEPGDSLRAVFF